MRARQTPQSRTWYYHKYSNKCGSIISEPPLPEGGDTPPKCTPPPCAARRAAAKIGFSSLRKAFFISKKTKCTPSQSVPPWSQLLSVPRLGCREGGSLIGAFMVCCSLQHSPSRLPIVRRPLELLTQKTPPGYPIRDSEETAGGRSENATKQAAKITHLDKGLELCDALAAQL